MESRLVLVIEGDDHIADELAAAIREADYEVVVSSTAAAGVAAAIEIRPDVVVCDMDLPDDDGYSVARSLRGHPSPVSVTPLLFLSAYDDPQARLEGFRVGADAYMTKPFRLEEVVAQVDALVQLASRLRRRRDSMLSIPPETQYGSTAIEGDVRQMSVATVLSVLGMERRTGVFEVVSKKRRAQIEIVAGYVAHGTIGGTRVAPLQALRVMLSWNVGRFSFMPLPPCDPPPSLHTVQAMLLDAAKAEDEAAAGMPSARTMLERHLATSFGGPPSRPGDTSPPSSRSMREAAAAPVSLAFDLISSRRADDLIAVDGQGGAARAALDRAMRPAAVPPPLPGAPPAGSESVGLSVSIDLEELSAELSMEEVISVRLDDLEPASVSSEEMPIIEETPRVQPVVIGPQAGLKHPAAKAPQAASDHRSTPTPPSGTPLAGLRRTPAIVPPPNSTSARSAPLPAPPAPPRPAPKTVRTAQRAAPSRTTPKKG